MPSRRWSAFASLRPPSRPPSAFGDSGQLSSVPAGGWLGSLTRRLGSYELREVMRQRDPRERRLLAHVHRGDPAGYIDHKFAAGELHLSDGIAAEACAIEAWLQAVHEHGIDQAVVVARNNDRRGRLNDRARDALEQAGLLGETMRVAEREFRVGERVIARLNSRAFDVDNGTRGTVIDGSEHRGLVMLTDAGERRKLPPSYVASHVEPSFCLTGHGMQGATVDWAAVVGQPGEFTRNWSYSACSRAREPTQLFIIDDQTSAELDREQIAPSPRNGEAPLARLAARMRVRDDEDLALDRLHDIADEPTTTPEQPAEASADRQHAPEDPDHRRVRGRALRDRLAELDTQARDRSPVDRERWQRVRDELERRRAQLHAAEQAAEASPPNRRWRKHRDAAEERERSRRLADSLADDVRVLETQERALAHQIPDPEQARVERHERVQALRELAELRDRHIEHAIENPPAYLLDTLGERPESRLERHGWDRAAGAIETYRFDHDVTDPQRTLGGEPSTGRGRYDYEHVIETITDARLALSLAPLDLGHDGRDISPGEDRGLER